VFRQAKEGACLARGLKTQGWREPQLPAFAGLLWTTARDLSRCVESRNNPLTDLGEGGSPVGEPGEGDYLGRTIDRGWDLDEGSRRLEEIRELFAFDRWATDRVLDSLADLTPGELGRDVGGSFPSVRETLAHTIGAGFFWLARWNGDPRGRRPESWVFTDLASLRARWVELTAELRAFLGALTAGGLDREVDIITSGGIHARRPLVETMRHVVNHASYHRGQVADQMRHLGANPAATDLFLFYHLRSQDAIAAG
jgi:uncharacterized damage-inducible protein DinB